MALGFVLVLEIWSGSPGNGLRWQSTAPEWLLWAFFLAEVGLVLRRRWRPWVALVGLLGIDLVLRLIDATSTPYGTAIGLFTVATQCGGRALARGTMVVAAVLAMEYFMGARSWSGTMYWGMTIVVAIAVSAYAAHERMKRLAMLRVAARERSQRRAFERAAERRAVADEVHDVVTHALAVSARLAEAALIMMPEDATSATRAVKHIEQVSREGLADLRHVVRDLAGRERHRPPRDLATMIDCAQVAGLPVSASVTGVPANDDFAALAHRTVLEALTNVMKHANPTFVSVLVEHREASVHVRVENDGVDPVPVPVPATAPAGRGIAALGERISRLGGRFTSSAVPDRGTWVVEAEIEARAQPSLSWPSRPKRRVFS